MIKKWKRFLEEFDSELKDKIEFLLYPQLDNLNSDWEVRGWIDIHEEKWTYKIGWIIETKQRDVLSNIDISKFEADYICEVRPYTITISETEIIKSEDKIYDIIFDGDIERINDIRNFINPVIESLKYKRVSFSEGDYKSWSSEKLRSGWVFMILDKTPNDLICNNHNWFDLLRYKNMYFNEIKSLTKFIVEDRFEITAKNVNYFS